MPSLVKIKVERGRDLPAADKTNVSTEQTTDAYVEVKLDDQVQRTSTCRKSDNPVWNEEFRFELIDDSVLQDAPVELKCFDHDIYSSEMIGVVYIDLNPLIMRTAHGSDRNMVISGWFPLFDTTRGVRGALLVTVKLQFIGNENPFGDSSAGVQFFSSSHLSSKCFIIQEVIGFVEDLVVEDNPENTWQDYFRKNKSQNDSRLKVLYNLSAEVRRELGKKVLESGGNAVLAYSVHFDTEGASGIVARAYGTACKLLKVDDEINTVVVPLQHVESIIPQCASEWRSIVDGTGCMALIQRDTAELLSLRLARDMNLSNSTGSGGGSSTNKSEGLVWAQADESRMVHFLQLTPFGATQSKASGGGREHAGSTGIFPATGKADFGGLDWSAAGVTVDNSNIFQSEVQLLSLRAFPDNVRIKLGGLVLARSVKFLGKLEASVSDQETREGWWSELRDEIKSHAKVLCCKHIIGYSETCTIFGDVCILTAMGTAAVLKRLAHPTSYLTHIGAVSVSNSNMLQVTTTGDGNSSTVGSGAGGNMQKGAISPNPRANRSSTNQSKTSQQQQQGDGIADSEPSPTFMECVNPMVVPGGVIPLQFPRSASDLSLNATTTNPQEGGITSTNANTPQSANHSSLFIRTQSANLESSRALMSQSKKMWIGDEGQGYDNSVTTPQSARGSAFGLLPPKKSRRPCVAAHVPYNHRTAPFSFMRLVPCSSCRRKWVPETLLASTDPPHALQVKGCGQMLEARVCRARKAATGEADAVKISEVLPFVEYDLQRQLILKLKVLGMNAAFGYSCKIQVGNELVIATATCTAVWLKSLPSPPPVQIVRSRDPRNQQELRLAALQRQLEDLMSLNKTTLDKQHSRNKLIVKKRSQVVSTATSSRFGYPVRKMSLSNASASSLANTGAGVLPDVSRESSGDELPTAMHEERSLASLEESLGSYSATSSSSASGSSTSSSSSSSSEDDTSDGDDSSSLESPPSSSSSSSTEKDEEENIDSSHAFEGEVDMVEGAMAAVTFDGDLPRSGHTSGSRSPKVSAMNLTEGRSSRFGSSATAATTSSTTNAGTGGVGATELLSKDKKAAIVETIRRKRRIVYKDDRAPFLMEVDDETDSDIIAVLNDWAAPIGITMVNTLFVPGSVEFPSGIGRNVVVMRRGRIMTPKANGSYSYTGSPPSSAALNNTLSKLFLEAYLRLCYTVKDLMPCQVLGTTHHVNIAEDGVVEVTVNAMVHKATKTQRIRYIPPPREPFAGAVGFIGDSLASRRSSGPPPLLAARSDSALEPLTAAGSSSPPGPARRAETLQYTSNSSLTSSSVIPVPVVNSSAIYDRDRRRTNSSDSNSTLPGELLLTNSSYVSGTDSEVPTGKVTPLSSASAVYGGGGSRLTMTPSSTGRHTNMSTVAPPLKAQTSTSGGSAGVGSAAGNSAVGGSAQNFANQVILTPLTDVPGARVKKYLGPILLHFLKDAIVVRGPTSGSMGSFYYLMVSEASAVARAHVAALGGNALLCYRLVPQESGGRAARSQTYSMFSVTGDAVLLEFASTTASTTTAAVTTTSSSSNIPGEMNAITGMNRQQSDNNISSNNFYQQQQGELSGSNSSGRFPTFSDNEIQH